MFKFSTPWWFCIRPKSLKHIPRKIMFQLLIPGWCSQVRICSNHSNTFPIWPRNYIILYVFGPNIYVHIYICNMYIFMHLSCVPSSIFLQESNHPIRSMDVYSIFTYYPCSHENPTISGSTYIMSQS